MMRKLLRYIMPVLSLVAVGCSSEEAAPEVENPREPRPDEVTLCLDVSYDGVGARTRAENDPDRFDPASGDFEKIESLRVIIVRGIETGENGKEKGIIEGNRLVATNEQGYPIYDNLEFKVIAGEMKRIYLIANEKYLDASPVPGQGVSAFLDSYTISKEVEINLFTNWTVSIPDVSATTVTTKEMGMFNPLKGRLLPLTEFFDVQVGERDEYGDVKDVPDNRWFTHLFLTRCAAKAQFFLKAGSGFAGENVRNSRITAITLSGVGNAEYVFPHETKYNYSKDYSKDYYKEELITNGPDKAPNISEAYIKFFKTPEANKAVIYQINDLNEEIKQTPSGEGMPTSKLIQNTLIYFPESILGEGKQYEVGVQIDGQNWFYAPLEDNILSVAGNDAVARNTYLPIEIEFTGAANFNVRVLPWNREDYYVDYTANVGFNDNDYLAITGTPGQAGDYLLLDKEAAQLVLNYGKVAQGRFFISSPVAAQWDAYLITTGGTTDAIQFQIPNPAYKNDTETPDEPVNITTTHISGKVGVDEARFGIVATVAPGDHQNSAQLMVIVTLADGTPVVANVLGPSWGTDTSKPDRLTIIENQQ